MTVETFMTNFGHLADAPNGVKMLRELILQLAVQGKLVPQVADDEPASVMLERISSKKELLMKEKKLRKTKVPMPYDGDDQAVLPPSWIYTTLFDVGEIAPRNDLSDDVDASFVPMPLISQKYGIPVQSDVKKWGEIKSGFTHFAEGDVSLAKITPCFQNGKSAVMRGLKNGLGSGTTELHIFRPIDEMVCSEYVLIFVKSPLFIVEGIPRMTGSAGQKRITRDYFAGKPFPFPPLEEQKRIVAKVDQLMALCNEFEARQQKQQQGRMRLNNAALDALLTAREPIEFADHWQRISTNFDLLYDHPENITKLRAAILKIAIQGKLVPQDPNDDPASVLLDCIKDEKGVLAAKVGIKKKYQAEVVEDEEASFDIPGGWCWSRFGELFVSSSGTTPSRSQKEYFKNGNFSWVKTTDLNNDIVFDCEEKITEKAVLDCNLKLYPVGTACVALYGGPSTVGKSGILGVSSTINQSVFALCPSDFVLPSYVHYYLKLIRPDWMKFAASLRVAGNINGKIVNQMPFPLPPLEEQKRIVAKVDQLMILCDELEAKLNQAQKHSGKLMEATVRQLLVS